MPKLGLAALVLVVLSGQQTLNHGCKDANQSLTSVPYSYYGTRDMRHSVALMPQKLGHRAPDSSSVPVTGIDREKDRDRMGTMLVNPVPADQRAASEARGEKKFMRTCTPCHGPQMDGAGPVAPMFMPPPDLRGEATRGRADGYIYSYIRYGGIVMPSYGAQVTAKEAWDLINYIRKMQRTNPQ